MPQPPVSPDEAWADLQPVLDAELARLPDKYRVPVVLCDLGGRPQREVARELGVPPATLANRLAAARRLLAKRLTARGVALSAGAVAAALGWHAATSAVPPALAASTVKAACAAAAGSAVGLPVPVVQLSEGVMRMFVLNKLKAVATGVVTCLVLLAGLGLVAGPSLRAGPEEKPATPRRPPRPTRRGRRTRTGRPDDLVFLRRTSLDLRGTLPTRLEAHYFLADTDPKQTRQDRRVDAARARQAEGHGRLPAVPQICPGRLEADDQDPDVHSTGCSQRDRGARWEQWTGRKPPAEEVTARSCGARIDVDRRRRCWRDASRAGASGVRRQGEAKVRLAEAKVAGDRTPRGPTPAGRNRLAAARRPSAAEKQMKAAAGTGGRHRATG